MILSENLIKVLKKNNISFFTGVPDSILSNFSNNIESLKKNKHIIASNEGTAVSIGIGYYLSTKKIPCVYMQNSGLSNAINPLISIANKKVYSIPLFLLIGWRGSPNQNDEPQHKEKGKITRELLKLLKIKYCILRNNKDLLNIPRLIKDCKKKENIVACLIEKGTLNTKKKKKKIKSNKLILRAKFIEKFLELVPEKSKIVSTTGYTSRELFQIRKNLKIKKARDFYMVGGMGHTSSVATGFSINTKKQIFCLDGDGSVLMHLGALSTVGNLKRKNLKHIILNNNCHESVGGQPTGAEKIDFLGLSKSLGYKNYFCLDNEKKLKNYITKFIKSSGPSLLEVRIKKESLMNLSRPKDLIYIKNNFMKNNE